MSHLRYFVCLLFIGLLSGGFLLGQEKKSDDREPIIIKGQLPRYFSKLGLNDKQKREIYKVKANYAAKIEELNKQLQALKDQEKGAYEKILTEAQRARLKELQTGAGSRDQDTSTKPTEVKK